MKGHLSAKAVSSKQKWTIVVVVAAFLAVGLMSVAGMGATQGAVSRPVTQTQTASNANPSSHISTVELVQPTMELPPNGRATALLVMRNTGPGALQDVHPTAMINADVALESTPAFDKTLSIPSKGELAWAITVSNKGEDPASGSVIFRIDYSQTADAAKPVPQVAYSILQLTGNNSAVVPEVKMESTLESLDQQHPGKVYLLITNKTDHSIMVRRDMIRWYKPSFVQITLDGPGGDKPEITMPVDSELILSPNQMQVIPFNVCTLSRVQPGKHLLVATVPLDPRGPAQGRSRNIVVTKEVQVGVIGESMLLKLLAIPSFLVIPGFIGLIIWGLLWKWGLFKSKRDTGSFPIEFAENVVSPQFWVTAITISIPVIWLYILTVNRDLLGHYGLSDLVNIWMASALLLGIGGYSLIIGGHKYHIGRITPSEKDQPIDILRKLERQGLGVCLDVVEFTAPEEGAKKTGLLLQKKTPDRDTIWVGPPIQVRWEPSADPESIRVIDNQRRIGGSPGQIAECIEKAGETVNIYWKSPDADSTDIDGLMEIPIAGMKETGMEDYIVEVQQGK